jgi:hypothetical protein
VPQVLIVQVLVLLVAGAGCGLAARTLLRGRAPLSAAATVLLGLVGVALAATVSSLVLEEPGAMGWKVLLLAVTATTVLLVGAAAVLRRMTDEPAVPHIRDQIAAGESAHVEFKSSARWNLHTGRRDPAIELVIAKTIAAFLNAGGGTLLVGVDDDGHAVGLANDYSLVKRPDRDRYELWLRDLLRSCLGALAAASVHVDFADVDGAEVCRLRVPPSPAPVYLRAGKGGEAQVWIRAGNSTRQLGVDEAIQYARHRWPASIGSAVRGQWRVATSAAAGAPADPARRAQRRR